MELKSWPNRQADKTSKQTHRQTNMQEDRQIAYRKIDKQTHRQIDRPNDIQTKR